MTLIITEEHVMADNTNKLGEMNRSSLDSIKSMLDANTIVGTPIETPGATIIPVSKISVGYASGGLDYAKKDASAAKPANFGGGGGTGISVTPVAFLVVKPSGEVTVLNISASTQSGTPADTVTQVVNFIEHSPELIERLRTVFTKKSTEENDI